MSLGHYILDGHNPVPEPDLWKWATCRSAFPNHVAEDFEGEIDGMIIRVSTVFLGLDHNHWGGPPILFETMIFGGPHDGRQNRCSTWDEAVTMHQQALDLVGCAVELKTPPG